MSYFQTKNYINDNYTCHYNSVSLDYYLTNKQGVTKVYIDDEIFVELQEKNINYSITKLTSFIKTQCKKTVINPIQEYFDKLETEPKIDQKELVQKLGQCFVLTSEEEHQQFIYHLLKWCARTIKTALDDEYQNKQCLTLTGETNKGKTGFLRLLCPKELREYYSENIPVGGKDERLSLAQNFIIMIDELSGLYTQDLNKLKATFTTAFIKDRLVYDKRTSRVPRICSFAGTTNEVEILADSTGNVRWLVFDIQYINWERFHKIIDIRDIWNVALQIMNKKEHNLTNTELIANEVRNQKYRRLTVEEEIVRVNIKRGIEHFMTATEITEVFAFRNKTKITRVKIGKALQSMNIERKMCSKSKLYKYSFSYTEKFNQVSQEVYSSTLGLQN